MAPGSSTDHGLLHGVAFRLKLRKWQRADPLVRRLSAADALTLGDSMSSSEHFSEAVTGPPSKNTHAVAEVLDAGPMSPSTPEVSRPTSAARTMELAALTAEQLLTDARVEAASLVSAARATADETAETSRKEVAAVEAQLARTKADLEAEIASLRQMGTDQRSQMRRLLTEQLGSLDSTRFEPPAVAAE